jgi:uncharacterized protein
MKILSDWFRSNWQRAREFVIHNVLHADDPPHRLALGVGIAMFITFTPTIGFQMGLVFALAWLFGGNKMVGLPLVWISNPATIVPIYYPCLWLGELLMGKPHRDFNWFKSFSQAPEEWGPKVQFFAHKFWDVAVELWVGCVVVGGVLGIISYYVTYWSVYAYRMKKWGQLVPPLYEKMERLEHPESMVEASSSTTEKPKVDTIPTRTQGSA